MNQKWVVGREAIVFFALLLFAVVINWPVLIANFMYPEQTLFYSANHLIHSWGDFIRIYTHPQLFDVAAPFFRPSGNFLLYQLLPPLFGWHNTQALLAVNFIFLGMIGYLLVKLYAELFPGFKVGGYIAFALYLMNPALILPRLTIMHFEFAYVFFVLLSWYSFTVFCRKNLQAGVPISSIKFQHLYLLLFSLLSYIAAVTFKESSIMLGPVLVVYFGLVIKQRYSFSLALKNKEVLTIVATFTAISAMLSCYLMMSWQRSYHPLLAYSTVSKVLEAGRYIAAYLFYLPSHYMPRENDSLMVEILRLAQMPQSIRYICWVLLAMTVITSFNVLRQQNQSYKTALVFLALAFAMFLVLPLMWGMGFPWHLSLTLVCEALLIGFGVEFYLKNFFTKQVGAVFATALALLLALATYQVDQVNIAAIAKMPAGFATTLNYNAIFHPPAIKNQLNENSILVVQDNKTLGDYFMGDSGYPALTITQTENFDFDKTIAVIQHNMFWRANPNYNGILFRWAYLLPNLKEEVAPFKNNDMRLIADATLTGWVRHLNNIYCVTYDAAGVWFDNTAVFKKNIVAELQRRHLVINDYQTLSAAALQANAVKLQRLPYADAGICQKNCDQSRSCKGFTYIHYSKGDKTLAQCFYYNKITAAKKYCEVCTGYIKKIKG